MPKQTFYNLPEEKRKLIIEVAIDEFATRGFQGASISQIVGRAGIAKGSFYQYFEDKHDLFMHLVELVSQAKLAYFQERTPPDPNLDIFAYLRWLFEIGYEFAAVESKLNQAVSRVLFGEGLYQGSTFKALREQSSHALTTLIRGAIDRGDINAAVDPQVAAFILDTLLNSLGQFLLTEQEISPEVLEQGTIAWLRSERARQIADSVLHVLESGMRSK
jgi:AcrR family transcriptional regulator